MLRLALPMLLVTACSTVQTGRELKSSVLDVPTCTEADLVVSATPADYPNVLLEVTEERSCTAENHETWAVQKEMRLSPYVISALGAAVGAAAGVGALFALQKSYDPNESLAYRGDATIILPFVGAVAGFGAVTALGPKNLTETLRPEIETETSVEKSFRHGSARNGTLALRDGTQDVIGAIRDGQAYLPVDEAARTLGEGLTLNGRPVEWSMRNAALWRPQALPECDRAAALGKMDKASQAELYAATHDAVVCAKAGWPFAETLMRKLDRICAKRFGAVCDGPVTK